MFLKKVSTLGNALFGLEKATYLVREGQRQREEDQGRQDGDEIVPVCQNRPPHDGVGAQPAEVSKEGQALSRVI